MDIKPYTHKVQYYETDQMGIVHHSNYIRWFEEARVDFMEQIGFGYERAVACGIDFAVTGVTCDYKSMFRFGDHAEVAMRILHLTPSRMTIGYEIKDKTTGELRTTGESRHCYFHNERQRPVSLKKELPELYEMFVKLADNEQREGLE